MTDPTTPEPKDIDEALLRLQANPPKLTKKRDGQVGQQHTKYADLIEANAVILPRLTELGLAWITMPTLRTVAGPNGQEDLRFVLGWEMKHIPSKTSRKGEFPLPGGAQPMQNGSAITYARRYALLAITNAVAEEDDDDGQGYRGRRGDGMAQRASVREEQRRPTAQRESAPAPRPERARPAEQPPLPEPRGQAPAQESTEPLRGRGGLITEPMTRKLAITMKEALGDDVNTRKQYIVDMIGRPVASSKELTFDEGRALIDAFEKANQDPDTAAVRVIEIYQRTTGGESAAPPARGERRGRRDEETRPVAEQTRDAVLGRPGAADDEPAPWELDPPEGPR